VLKRSISDRTGYWTPSGAGRVRSHIRMSPRNTLPFLHFWGRRIPKRPGPTRWPRKSCQTLDDGCTGQGQDKRSNRVVDESKIIGRCETAFPEECPPLSTLCEVAGEIIEQDLQTVRVSLVLRRWNVARSTLPRALASNGNVCARNQIS
jgi:hypothetical protein